MATMTMNHDATGESSDARFHLGYRRWLDGLRGIAVLLVLAFHFKLVGGGWLGVDVFFVLSGFLITTLLVEEWENRGSISLKRFYLRRALRLMPAFYVLLILCGLYAWLCQSSAQAESTRAEIVVAACYVADYPFLTNTPMSVLGHTWSLSVEEQFYLLWPILFLCMLRLRLSRRWILGIVCAGIAVCVVHRIVLYHRFHSPESVKTLNKMRMYFGLDTRADALLVGCLVGLLAAWNKLPTSKKLVDRFTIAAWTCAGLFAYLVWKRSMDHLQFYHGLFTGVALMAATILIRLLIAPSKVASVVLEARALVGIGRISYALYLFHVPIIYWTQPEDLGWSHPGSTLLVAGLTFAAALVSYYCIERPCLKLKKHFETHRTAPASIAAQEQARPRRTVRPSIEDCETEGSLRASSCRQCATSVCHRVSASIVRPG